jgi:hypothetical protein
MGPNAGANDLHSMASRRLTAILYVLILFLCGLGPSAKLLLQLRFDLRVGTSVATIAADVIIRAAQLIQFLKKYARLPNLAKQLAIFGN